MNFRALQWDYHTEAILVERMNAQRQSMPRASSCLPGEPAVLDGNCSASDGEPEAPPRALPEPPPAENTSIDCDRNGNYTNIYFEATGIQKLTKTEPSHQVTDILERISRFPILTQCHSEPNVSHKGCNGGDLSQRPPQWLDVPGDLSSTEATFKDTRFTEAEVIRFWMQIAWVINYFQNQRVSTTPRLLPPISETDAQSQAAAAKNSRQTESKPASPRLVHSNNMEDQIGNVYQDGESNAKPTLQSIDDSPDYDWEMREFFFQDDDSVHFPEDDRLKHAQDTCDDQKHEAVFDGGDPLSENTSFERLEKDLPMGVATHQQSSGISIAEVQPPTEQVSRVSFGRNDSEVEVFASQAESGDALNDEGLFTKKRKSKSKKRKDKKKRHKKEKKSSTEHQNSEKLAEPSPHVASQRSLAEPRGEGGTLTTQNFFNRWKNRDDELAKARENQAHARSMVQQNKKKSSKKPKPSTQPRGMITASKSTFTSLTNAPFRQKSDGPASRGIGTARSLSMRSSLSQDESVGNLSKPNFTSALLQRHASASISQKDKEPIQDGPHSGNLMVGNTSAETNHAHRHGQTKHGVQNERLLFEQSYENTARLIGNNRSRSALIALADAKTPQHRDHLSSASSRRENNLDNAKIFIQSKANSATLPGMETNRNEYPSQQVGQRMHPSQASGLNSVSMSRLGRESRIEHNMEFGTGLMPGHPRVHVPFLQGTRSHDSHQATTRDRQPQDVLVSRAPGPGSKAHYSQDYNNAARLPTQEFRHVSRDVSSLGQPYQRTPVNDVNHRSLQPFELEHQTEKQDVRPIEVFCRESFLESWPSIVGKLASGQWRRQMDQMSASLPRSRRIILSDTPLIDQCMVDIELCSQSAISLCLLSALTNVGAGRAKILEFVTLSAIGRYRNLFVVVVLDIDSSAANARKAMLQLQTATIRPSSAAQTSTHIIPTKPSCLPQTLAKIILETTGSEQSDSLSELDPLTISRARFLLNLAPNLTARGAIQSIREANEVSGGTGSSFAALLLSERTRQQLSLRATSTPSRAPDVNPSSLVQISMKARAFSGNL